MEANLIKLTDNKKVEDLEMSMAYVDLQWELVTLDQDEECNHQLIACNPKIKADINWLSSELFNRFQELDCAMFIAKIKEGHYDFNYNVEIDREGLDRNTENILQVELFKEKYLGKGKVWIEENEFEEIGLDYYMINLVIK